MAPIKPWLLKPKRSLGIFEGISGVLDDRDQRAQAAQKAQESLEDRMAMRDTRAAQAKSRSLDDALKQAEIAAASRPPERKIVGEVTDPTTGQVYNRYSDGTAEPVRMGGAPSVAMPSGHENDDAEHGPSERQAPAQPPASLRVGVKPAPAKDPILREVGGDLYDVTDPKKPVLVQKGKAPGPTEAQIGARETRKGAREDRLQQNFQQDPAVKQAGVIANAVAQLKAAAAQKTPQGDLNMIYGIVKLRDPNSAVREGEIDLQRAARSVGTRVTAAWQKAVAGHTLTDTERAEIMRLADQTVDEQGKLVAPVQKRYGLESRQVGADSAFVAPDPFAGVRVQKTAAGVVAKYGLTPPARKP